MALKWHNKQSLPTQWIRRCPMGQSRGWSRIHHQKHFLSSGQILSDYSHIEIVVWTWDLALKTIALLVTIGVLALIWLPNNMLEIALISWNTYVWEITSSVIGGLLTFSSSTGNSSRHQITLSTGSFWIFITILVFSLSTLQRETTIFLILFIDPLLISMMQISCPLTSSDHNIITFRLNGTTPQTSVSHGYYDFNRADYISLNKYLSEIDSWYQVFQQCLSVEECWSSFVSCLEEGIKLDVPFVFRNPSNISRIRFETIL